MCGPSADRFCCICSDVDLDAVVSSTDRLSHPTASRPRVTDRRPRSQIITPVGASHSFSHIKLMASKVPGQTSAPCFVSRRLPSPVSL